LPHLPVTPICYRLFFDDPATTQIYALSLHDALPISVGDPADQPQPVAGLDVPQRRIRRLRAGGLRVGAAVDDLAANPVGRGPQRSEEHTSELQSRGHLVCRLLLEKKNK